MKLAQPTATAYLTDKAGKIHETLPIYAKNPKKDVAAMNGTCKSYTDGKLFWTLNLKQTELP
jgi:hypothetical protein